VIFAGSVREEKVMGVEYIVSVGLFAGLSEDEKAVWLNHVHEVKSGTLVAPGLPEVAQHELMTELVSTNGKAGTPDTRTKVSSCPSGLPAGQGGLDWHRSSRRQLSRATRLAAAFQIHRCRSHGCIHIG